MVKTRPAILILVATVTSLAMYVGAYYTTATAGRHVLHDNGIVEGGGSVVDLLVSEGAVLDGKRGLRTSILPWYVDRQDPPEVNENRARFFFPLHWLDRRVRPHVWDQTHVWDPAE